MKRLTRFVLIALGSVVALVVLAALLLPLFLNADSFRANIESTLSKSLGRKVTIGKLNLSVFSGGLVAQNATVADDPRFSTQPFIQAESVKIGVEVLPLLLSRQIHVRGFVLQSPQIQLLRAANGMWNYSSISSASNKPAAHDAQTKSTFPDLTVGHVDVENARITVGTAGTASVGNQPSRVYEQVNLQVKNFDFAKSFPFTVSAHLPGEGTVNLSGTAGPLNQQDASETPFSGNLEIKHLDPLKAGFVTATDGISGTVESLVLDATSTGQQLHITKLIVDSPNLTIVRSNKPKPLKPAGANPEGFTMLQKLSVDEAQVKNGTLTLQTAGHTGAPAVYQQLNAQVTNLTPTSSSPFSVSAQLPGGGSLSANGKAGPFNQENDAATPVDARVSLKHVQLETSGALPPDAGISGITDFQAQVQSNGQTLHATGTAHVDGIKLAKDGRPSAKPVDAQFALAQDERAMTGDIQHATVTIGRAVINLAGTYQSSGQTTALNLKVNGNAMPIDELEAFLPALGVQLPQGSQLQGGTVTTALTVSGATASPVISGPVHLENTKLAGFDLGAKLHTLSQLTGGRIGGATGSGTNIRSLSMNVREAGGGIRTDNIALDIAGLGTATGAGSVSPARALDYNVVLKLTGLTSGSAASGSAGAEPAQAKTQGGAAGIAGGLAGLLGGGGSGGSLSSIAQLSGGALKNGIPVAIGGTTSNPTFAPNMRGLAASAGASAVSQLLGGKTAKGAAPGKTPDTPLSNALGGLLGKHN